MSPEETQPSQEEDSRVPWSLLAVSEEIPEPVTLCRQDRPILRLLIADLATLFDGSNQSRRGEVRRAEEVILTDPRVKAQLGVGTPSYLNRMIGRDLPRRATEYTPHCEGDRPSDRSPLCKRALRGVILDLVDAAVGQLDLRKEPAALDLFESWSIRSMDLPKLHLIGRRVGRRNRNMLTVHGTRLTRTAYHDLLFSSLKGL